jgi:hypothetical protein
MFIEYLIQKYKGYDLPSRYVYVSIFKSTYVGKFWKFYISFFNYFINKILLVSNTEEFFCEKNLKNVEFYITLYL